MQLTCMFHPTASFKRRPRWQSETLITDEVFVTIDLVCHSQRSQDLQKKKKLTPSENYSEIVKISRRVLIFHGQRTKGF